MVYLDFWVFICSFRAIQIIVLIKHIMIRRKEIQRLPKKKICMCTCNFHI